MLGIRRAKCLATQGRATYSMEPSHYAVVPEAVARGLLE